MQCAKCGLENPADAKFCGRCGETLRVAAPPPVPVVDEAVSSGLKTGIIIGTVFIPLLGIIMGAIYMNDANLEKKKAGRLWLYVGIGVFALECICAVIAVSVDPSAFNQ